MSAQDRPGLDELRAFHVQHRVQLWTPNPMDDEKFPALVRDGDGKPVAQFVTMETARLYVTLLGHMDILLARVADLEEINRHLREGASG